MMKVSPEFKQLHGRRDLNSDGFTYPYGKHKGGFTKSTRHGNLINRLVRHDKRAVRQAEDRRYAAEAFAYLKSA